MALKILAVLEQREGLLKKASFETAAQAAKLAKEMSGDVRALVIGGDVKDVEALAAYGIKEITYAKKDELTNYSSSAYTKIAVAAAEDFGADTVLLPNTAWGKDLAPRIAARLDAALAMDCVELIGENGTIAAVRPVYAGKARVKVSLESDKKVFTLRPNVFTAEKTDTPEEPTVMVEEPDDIDLSVKVVELKQSTGKLDVAEADIIVSGGRGLKEAENFSLIENLAAAFGAAVGASRAVVDAGWRPHSEQVGQTGKTVSPTLYVACGISGAIQHLAGMSSSKYIVAVNKDKDAPIFNIADYGIVGDVFEILPKLTEEVKKAKS